MSLRRTLGIAIILILVSLVGMGQSSSLPSLPPVELLALSGSTVSDQDLMGTVALVFLTPGNDPSEKGCPVPEWC